MYIYIFLVCFSLVQILFNSIIFSIFLMGFRFSVSFSWKRVNAAISRLRIIRNGNNFLFPILGRFAISKFCHEKFRQRRKLPYGGICFNCWLGIFFLRKKLILFPFWVDILYVIYSQHIPITWVRLYICVLFLQHCSFLSAFRRQRYFSFYNLLQVRNFLFLCFCLWKLYWWSSDFMRYF